MNFMYLDTGKAIIKILLSSVIFFILFNAASAQVEIADFYSDFTSSDVTFRSSEDFQGKAVFLLFTEGVHVESHEIPLKVKAGDPITKVLLWEIKPQKDYYTAKVSIYKDTSVLASKSYHICSARKYHL